MLLTTIAPINSYDQTGAGYPIEAVDGVGKISSLVYRRVSVVHGCQPKMVGSSIIDILGALKDRDEGTNRSGMSKVSGLPLYMKREVAQRETMCRFSDGGQ